MNENREERNWKLKEIGTKIGAKRNENEKTHEPK